MKLSRLSLLMLIVALGALCLDASAQVRRNVTTCNPLSRNKGGYDLQVYDYESVDVRPQFPGGERSMINFINETREYPYDAYHNHVQGRVLCSFVVGADGKLFDIQVIQGSGDDSLDREAMRVISKMPKWKAGMVGTSKVNVLCIIPIAFRL